MRLLHDHEWVRALDLIEFLPPTSHYISALMQDDDLAEQLADKREARSSNHPALTEWSAEVHHLAVIADALHSIRTLFLQANGAKGVRPPTPMDRPETAEQRMQRRRVRSAREHISSKLLPGNRRRAI